MNNLERSRKEDMARVLNRLEAMTEARIQDQLKKFEVVRVIPSISGITQEVVHVADDEEEAERYTRLYKAFPPSNADYYYKPWGTPLKEGK